MTPFDILKVKQLTHNELSLEKCHWCATKNNIDFYFFENKKELHYGGMVWSCEECLETNKPPSPEYTIEVHKMSTQDIFTLKLLFPDA